MMVGRNSEFLGPCVEDSFELTSMHNIIMMSYICTLKHTTAAYSLRDTHREATHGRVRPSISINLDRLKIRLMTYAYDNISMIHVRHTRIRASRSKYSAWYLRVLFCSRSSKFKIYGKDIMVEQLISASSMQTRN